MEKRLTRFLATLLQRGILNTTSIIIHYVDKPDPVDPDYDKNIESSYAAPEQKTVTVKGLMHIVSVRTSQRQFTEIKTGDAIVTFENDIRDANVPDDPDDPRANIVDLSAMEEIRFEINGDSYVQQATGKELSQYWDAIIGGNPISQTLLLRLSN